MKTLFEESRGTYQRVGDYYLPDLELPQQTEKANYGRYGRMRKEFLKNNHKGIYSSILLDGTLNRVLNEADFAAKNAVEQLIKDMAAVQGLTEKLQATDQMAWVGAMNNIREAAEEIILNEIIYR
ncbi:MAG: hypothetical protein VR72_09670 [Clostridiaceae bacterium BRH_c20a]|nr:MAG: hypothetical protein VR72_09670 [Clostridiaceae bacterium BRH_c20a]